MHKSVRIPSFSGPYFSAFGLNTERYGKVFSPNAGKYAPEKLQIRIHFTQCWSLSVSLENIRKPLKEAIMSEGVFGS